MTLLSCVVSSASGTFHCRAAAVISIARAAAPALRTWSQLVGIDVDQLDHPVAVRAAGRGHEIDLRHPGDLQGLFQRLGDIGKDVRTAVDAALAGRDSLVVLPTGGGKTLLAAHSIGVARDALEPAALAASTSSSMKANPVSLSSEQLLEMLEAAWE